MINPKNLKFLIAFVVLLNMPACGYIKSLFPDKEKDYQYTTEIAPLTLPSDLGKNEVLKVPASLSATHELDVSTDNNAAPVAPANSPAETAELTPPVKEPVMLDDTAPGAASSVIPETEPSVKEELISVELLKSGSGENRLHIAAPIDQAWRIVGKALSRKSLEITNRNQKEGLFHVQYDPDEQKVEDGSLWDEAAFIFRGLQGGKEKEYLVKLRENAQQTDVVVLDEQQNPSTDAGALSLLTLLQTTIKTDLTGK